MNISSFGSICSGVGMQEMAYKEVFNDNIKYFAEIDKFAIKSYNAIHGDIKNLGDFTKVVDVDETEFMFASTPCQDFSISGKRKGFEGMRGTLTFEWVKMLQTLKNEDKMPEVIGFENVPGIISKKFLEGFELFKSELEKIGYKLQQGILNAKKYEIPQNRNRVFLVGFKENVKFKFPNEMLLELRLKDMLEDEVDEKYYLSQEKVDLFKKQGDVNPSGRGMNGNVNTKDIADTLTTNKGEGPKILIAGHTNDNYEQNARTYDINGLAPTLAARDYKDPKKILVGDRIRKLTPRECWRLMGIKDEYFEKAVKVNSNSQLYKQAGNGIVVNVLVEIFKEIKKAIIVEPSENIEKFDMLKTGEKQFKLF